MTVGEGMTWTCAGMVTMGGDDREEVGRAAGGFMVWGKFAGKGRMEPSWEVLSGVG